MHVEITPRNYQLTQRVRDHIEERASKFTRYAHDLKQARFTLIAEKLDMGCEIHIHLRGRDFHATARSQDMLTSVEQACASMDEQLSRHKAKVTDHKARFAQPGLTSAAALEKSLGAPGADAPAGDDDAPPQEGEP